MNRRNYFEQEVFDMIDTPLFTIRLKWHTSLPVGSCFSSKWKIYVIILISLLEACDWPFLHSQDVACSVIPFWLFPKAITILHWCIASYAVVWNAQFTKCLIFSFYLIVTNSKNAWIFGKLWAHGWSISSLKFRKIATLSTLLPMAVQRKLNKVPRKPFTRLLVHISRFFEWIIRHKHKENNLWSRGKAR